MNISEKLQTIAENEQKVYDAGIEQGKKAEYNKFWDAIQNYGNRTYYDSAFYNAQWTKETFKPRYSIKPTSLASCFMALNNVPPTLEQIDFVELAKEQGIEFDISNCTNFHMAFATGGISRLGTIDMAKVTTVNMTFYGAYNQNQGLKRIERLICYPTNVFSNTFGYCRFLEYIGFEGEIATNGLDLQWSTKLSKASIESVINCLSTTASGLSVTLSKAAVNKAFETSEGANDGATSTEWTTLIGTRSNWTISLV